MEFVVRNNPNAGLEGALRIHLPPESIHQAGLAFNEPCDIVDEHDRIVGRGIAWRAADKMGASPKSRPARMSEMMRDAFGIKEGSLVKIQPVKAEIVPAEKIVLTDVTSDPSSADTSVEADRWLGRCRIALYNAEAIASGITFETSAPKKGLKKRFHIESIVGPSAPVGAVQLFYANDKTDITISDGANITSLDTITNGFAYTPISTDGIGGLVDQIETLNANIRLVLEQSRSDAAKQPANRCNWPLLLHGYEGTGKTLLLHRAARTGFRKALHLNTELLTANASKNKSLIAEIFHDARAHQPSIVLIDDIHKLASVDEERYAGQIGEELDRLVGEEVLVLATARSLGNVHATLLRDKRFNVFVELPIPDQDARTDIFKALLSDAAPETRNAAEHFSSRTHGFTCRDIAKLIDYAQYLGHSQGLTQQNGTHGSRRPSTHDGELANVESESLYQLSVADIREALASNNVRPTALREIFFETPKIKWTDIGGSQPIKSQFDEIIGWPLKHADLMKQLDLPAQKGMLLYGPPGCSKTLTAQAVAANYDMNFIAVKGAELISMYVGESERAVREIFRKARTAKPCIIFFDEIDSIASERDSAGTKGLNVLTTLLNEMDGFESLDGVFVLAATNKPEVLDPAIMRPGRFDQHVYLPPPNDNARQEILERHISSGPREDDLDTSKLVRATAGYSGAEVVAVCHLAKKSMARRLLSGQGRTLRMDDFENALREIKPRITREMLEGYEAFAQK